MFELIWIEWWKFALALALVFAAGVWAGWLAGGR
jgi:hypothetical protein